MLCKNKYASYLWVEDVVSTKYNCIWPQVQAIWEDGRRAVCLYSTCLSEHADVSGGRTVRAPSPALPASLILVSRRSGNVWAGRKKKGCVRSSRNSWPWVATRGQRGWRGPPARTPFVRVLQLIYTDSAHRLMSHARASRREATGVLLHARRLVVVGSAWSLSVYRIAVIYSLCIAMAVPVSVAASSNQKWTLDLEFICFRWTPHLLRYIFIILLKLLSGLSYI